jgi:hypothetical protein
VKNVQNNTLADSKKNVVTFSAYSKMEIIRTFVKAVNQELSTTS